MFKGGRIIYFLHKILPSQLLKFQRRYFEILGAVGQCFAPEKYYSTAFLTRFRIFEARPNINDGAGMQD